MLFRSKPGLVPREAMANPGFRQLRQRKGPKVTWGDRKHARILRACLSCPVPWNSLRPGWGEPSEPCGAAGGR